MHGICNPGNPVQLRVGAPIYERKHMVLTHDESQRLIEKSQHEFIDFTNWIIILCDENDQNVIGLIIRSSKYKVTVENDRYRYSTLNNILWSDIPYDELTYISLDPLFVTQLIRPV